jgi:small subunit ribosomal protein S18
MAGKIPRQRRPAEREVKTRKNQFAVMGLTAIDYKDAAALRTFISERGKIRSRRVTGLTVQQQRQVNQAIKNAREMALLPYPGQRSR